MEPLLGEMFVVQVTERQNVITLTVVVVLLSEYRATTSGIVRIVPFPWVPSTLYVGVGVTIECIVNSFSFATDIGVIQLP